MKRIRHIINEVKELEKFRAYRDIIDFLKSEYGILADIEIFMNYVDIYVGDLKEDSDNDTTNDTITEDKVSKALKTFFNKQDYGRKAEAVWQTEYGYVIVMESDEDIFEEKLRQENALMYYYHSDQDSDLGSDISDEDMKLDKNSNYHRGKGIKLVKEASEREVLDSMVGDKDEDTTPPKPNTDKDTTHEPPQDKETISTDSSNVVLDNKFIWFFNILDRDENEIESDITELEEAIDFLVDRDGAMIVALPYVDPSPEDDNVDLVFADNPGPVIVYDGR